MTKSTILGPDGRPFDLGTIDEPQTARLGHLQRELQSHPTRGLTPSRLAQILDAAEHGDLVAQFELFEDMEEKDGHIASEMSKRRRAPLVDWEVVPPTGASAAEKHAAELLGDLMLEIPDFEDMLFDVTDAIGKGFACLELEWHKPGKYWLPKTITHRPQSWFQLHRGYRQELRLRSNTTDEHGVVGEPLRPFGWITHTHKAKSGYMERTALFRQLVWTYLFKNYSVGDLAEFLEIYGIPVRIGKYPPNAKDAEKATLLRALVGIGHKAAAIVPEGMLIEFENAATGDPKAFELMISWCERNQSKVILGGTLTSGADGKASTNALGNVHNEVRKDLRDGDIRQLNTTVTRDLVYAIASINGLARDGVRRAPQFRLNVGEIEDLKEYADALPKLANVGLQIPVQWAQEKLGIPQPEEGQAVLGAPAPAPAAPDVLAVLTAVLGLGRAPGIAALTGIAPAAAAPTPLQAQTAQVLQPAVSAWVEQIRELVARAGSLAEIRDGLVELLPNMTLDQYAAAMGEALTAAELLGRSDVLQEAAMGGA